jgi:hypothetical protein
MFTTSQSKNIMAKSKKKKEMKHSKYYYDYTRNINENKDNSIDYKSTPIPHYYIGKIYGYEARKVVEDWNLSFNVGTAVSYLLRSSYKHDSPFEDIQKAINHLKFELDKLNNNEQ